MNVMPSMTNAVVMTTVSTPLISPSFVGGAEFVGGEQSLRSLEMMVHRQCDERGEGHDAGRPSAPKISTAWPKVVQCVWS